MTRFRIADLRAKEARGERPKGYADAVIRSGHEEGEFVVVDFAAAARLRAQFSTDPATLGFGDLLEWFCRQTGIKSMVKRLERQTGRKCGCAHRQATLNRWGAAITGKLRALVQL